MATPRSQKNPKRQRLLLALAALASLTVAGLIAVSALEDTASYFKSPADLVEDRPAPGQSFRLGGLVKPGSVTRSQDGLVLRFEVTDHTADTPVSYKGLVPDLFREGQGVIATGSFDAQGRFQAEQLLAKHDENYMPPEVAKALENSGHPMDAGKGAEATGSAPAKAVATPEGAGA